MGIVRKPVSRQFDSLSRQQIEKAVEQFGLGKLQGVHTLVIEGDHVVLLSNKSETSRKYVIDTAKGRFFLKEIPWYCDNQAARTFSRSLMNHLADAGLPVPRVLQTTEGEWYAAVEESRFVLLEYLAGSPYDHSTGRYRSAAAVLGSMHAAVRDFVPEPDAPQDSLRQISLAHLDLALEVRPPAQSSRAGFEAVRELMQDKFDGGIEGSAPRIAVHGDFIPWNLGFSKDGAVVAIHDFDNACMDSALHDLGEAISSFFLVPHDGQSAILREIDRISIPTSRIADFITSYRLRCPLPEEALSMLPLWVVGAWWESVLLSYVRGDQTTQCTELLLKFPRELDRSWPNILAAFN
jgi:Ser/Thr protein kinase RdoA (MazF antagonist)